MHQRAEHDLNLNGSAIGRNHCGALNNPSVETPNGQPLARRPTIGQLEGYKAHRCLGPIPMQLKALVIDGDKRMEWRFTTKGRA